MHLNKRLLIGLLITLFICGCGQSRKPPDAALYVYKINQGKQTLIRSVGWAETEPLLAVSDLLNSSTAQESAEKRIENPDYILEFVNKGHYTRAVVAPVIVYIWIEEHTEKVHLYCPDISAGTASAPNPYGPYDAGESTSARFLTQVIGLAP